MAHLAAWAPVGKGTRVDIDVWSSFERVHTHTHTHARTLCPSMAFFVYFRAPLSLDPRALTLQRKSASLSLTPGRNDDSSRVQSILASEDLPLHANHILPSAPKKKGRCVCQACIGREGRIARPRLACGRVCFDTHVPSSCACALLCALAPCAFVFVHSPVGC